MQKSAPSSSNLVLAKPRVEHAPAIHKLVTYWAARTPVLPKSLGFIYEELREFIIVLDGEKVVGAAALHIDWADLAEVRSVVVAPEYQGRGVGKMLIDGLMAEAEALGLEKVFCLTDKPEWFARLGFGAVDKADLPQKVWRDCIHCPIFTRCTEVAMGRSVRG